MQGREGGAGERGYAHTQSYFTLLYSRNEFNIVKQKKKKKNHTQLMFKNKSIKMRAKICNTVFPCVNSYAFIHFLSKWLQVYVPGFLLSAWYP